MSVRPSPLRRPVGGDVQLCEVALESAAPDGLAKAENCESVGTVADGRDERVAALEQLFDSSCEWFDCRCGFVELAVEVVQELRDCSCVVAVCVPHWRDVVRHLR